MKARVEKQRLLINMSNRDREGQEKGDVNEFRPDMWNLLLQWLSRSVGTRRAEFSKRHFHFFLSLTSDT